MRFISKTLMAMAIATSGFVSQANGQNFPTRPVTIVVPFSAGSGTDTGARLLAQHLKDSLGQSVVIDNKPGASGTIAATSVAQARPDGHTLLMGTNSTHSANPSLIKNLPYDPAKDFKVIGLVGTFEGLLTVTKDLPVKTPEELVAYGRANPGKLSFATGNTTSLVMAELFTRRLGIEAVKVPYKSNPEALTDLVAGRVSMMFPDIASSKPHVDAGTIRALGTVTMGEPTPLAPNLPTLSKTLVPDLKLVGWIALFAPANTPDAIVERLSKDVEAAVNKPAFKEGLAKAGANATFMGSKELKDYIADETTRFAAIFNEIGLKPE
jgi:tripartite-type tricarboxylate transporter receptor subunit TctC